MFLSFFGGYNRTVSLRSLILHRMVLAAILKDDFAIPIHPLQHLIAVD